MELSPRAAELTTLLESRITNFYTNLKVDEIGRAVQGIMDLHHDISFFLILILVFVSRMLVRALWRKIWICEARAPGAVARGALRGQAAAPAPALPDPEDEERSECAQAGCKPGSAQTPLALLCRLLL